MHSDLIAKLSREQAQAFIDSLFPAGEHCWLNNPTRTYFSALIGDIPNSRPYLDSDPNQEKLRQLAGILRQIADHIEISGEAAQLKALEARDGQYPGLTPQLRDALAELYRYTENRNVIYWWRRASMAKLAEMGLAETYRPSSVSRTRKMLPYRITPAGRAALTEGKDE